MVVEDMAIIPPRKMLSIRCQPKPVPTVIPKRIIQNMMVQAAIIAAPPTFTIFLKESSATTSSNTGDNDLQGPHQVAKKSTTTG